MSSMTAVNDDIVATIAADIVVETSQISAANDVINSLNTLSTSAKLELATLVFLDIETTGLAAQVGVKNVQVTEISMIAIDRNEFIISQYADLRDIRVVHKMSLCIRPSCTISAGAERLTGLSNQNLMRQNLFDRNAANALTAFLSHLPKPVALLAHNGKAFDFPILQSEFLKLGYQIPPDIYIIDTLSAVRCIGVPSLPSDQTLPENIKLKKNGDISYSLENLHLYFFGKSHLGNHSSEGDCIALAKVCYKLKDKILPWIEDNLRSFDSINPLW